MFAAAALPQQAGGPVASISASAPHPIQQPECLCVSSSGIEQTRALVQELLGLVERRLASMRRSAERALGAAQALAAAVRLIPCVEIGAAAVKTRASCLLQRCPAQDVRRQGVRWLIARGPP